MAWTEPQVKLIGRGLAGVSNPVECIALGLKSRTVFEVPGSPEWAIRVSHHPRVEDFQVNLLRHLSASLLTPLTGDTVQPE
jgi:hypothetical protein